jgi:hypothetical protein
MPTMLFLLPALAVPLPTDCPCQASGGLAFHHEREYALEPGVTALVKADSIYRTDRCPLATSDVSNVYFATYEPVGNADITFNVKEYTSSAPSEGLGPGMPPPGTKKVIVKVRNATAGSSQVIALEFASMNPAPVPSLATLREYKVRYTNDFLTGIFTSTITNIHGSNIYYQHKRPDGTWPNPVGLSGVTSKMLYMYFGSLDPGNGAGTGGGIGGGIGAGIH